VRDYTEASRQEPQNRDIKASLREAELALKKAKRKDHYKILCVAQDATEIEIKRAYRKAALVHHPGTLRCSFIVASRAEELKFGFLDKCNGDDEARAEAEKKFKDITEAYSVLSDPVKRRRFDQGVDDEPGFGGGGP